MTCERRKFARIRLDAPASLFLYQVDVRLTGAIIDLSMGGCFFPIKNELPLGEKCHLQLLVGEGLEAQSINLTGIIARRDNTGVGIQFTDLTPQCLASLECVISQVRDVR